MPQRPEDGQGMDYYKKSIRALAILNIIIAVGRAGILILNYHAASRHGLAATGIRMLMIFLMGILLILIIRGLIGIAEALGLSLVIFCVYLWLAFVNYTLNYDTITNIGVMNLLYSTLCIYQCYREETAMVKIRKQKPVMLDLRIKDAGDLFRPLVIGPHLEFSQEITGAVDYYLGSLVRPAPLELNIYGGTVITSQMKGTAKEAYREHYEDERRRTQRNLEKHTRRSLVLFGISMAVMFMWTHYNNLIGNSPVWTILGSMGGFFLWEIGNTHFRHTDEFEKLELTLIALEAKINFL